ncbi:MAG: hypothetical protein IJ958_00680 [Agathobacter sp.]|nr:hypothetical protein [Agathobacter sp.]
MANKRMAKKAAKKAEMKAVEAKKVVQEKPAVKTIEIKPIEKVEEVVAEVKEEAVVAEEIVVAEVKEETVVVAEETREEKPKAKRTRKAKIKTSIVVQARDREVTMEEAIERATEDWCKSGNDRADLKEIAVYVKPEEAGIFYVINGKATGRVAF